jgi:rSAM/selenodomain-associated transferase 1
VLPSLILFARVPRIGLVKTRLAPRLTPAGALALYWAFLEDASRAYAASGEWSPVVVVDPDPDDAGIAALFPDPWRREPQGEGTLGERLTAAFAREFARGVPAALAVGSDHPSLAASTLADALEMLATGRTGAAAVPAEDGGYCAIALSAGAPWREAFREIPWSTGDVLVVTERRLAERGSPLTLLSPGYDVDRPEDLDRLRRDLAARDASAADYPHATAFALARLP